MVNALHLSTLKVVGSSHRGNKKVGAPKEGYFFKKKDNRLIGEIARSYSFCNLDIEFVSCKA